MTAEAATALSIFAAAAECPGAPALVTVDAALTFAQCAAAVRARAAPPAILVAHPTTDTLLVVYAALAARRPIALLHPRATADDHARQRAQLAAAPLTADDALVLFTSGSTGASRGVVLGRAALAAAARAHAAHLPWRAGDAWLACLPFAHAGGLAIAVRSLAARKPVLLADSPRALLAERATLVSLVPAQLAALLAEPTWRPPAAWRAVLLGGAAAPPALVDAATARGVPILTTYGLTETFGQIATARPGDLRLHPLPGVELVTGTPAAPAPIRIRAPQLAARYLEPPAAIAPELATADLGYLEHGTLVVVGRADDVIITGGENVHPAAVEAVLAATPGVRAACAFGVADARWGQLVGAALAVDASLFDHAAALARWHAALPPHARPRRLALVSALPLSPNGKVDRRAAAQLPAPPVAY